MSVVLFRVDERLIHGQVVVGWGSQLHPDRIIVVDDELAASQWEQELYELGLPPGIASEFASIAAARAALHRWQDGGERVFLLTRDVATMLRLAEGGLLNDSDINIGGIHHAPGRRQVLPYVYLSNVEEDALRGLASEGAHVTARDLPAARRVSMDELLQEARG
jgi:PTS system mannose-specific IIB component/fructoselysine and glucoselysine-specific PTS system IIB component